MVNTTVNTVSEFIEVLLEFNRKSAHFHSPSVHSLTLYRGQADLDWGLSPRLYREGLFDKEAVLISEFLRVAPEHFEGMSYFDKLAKMQHYRLPTRLLDATQNPLVALFFACCDENHVDKDGAVYAFSQLPVFKQETNDISLIMKYIFEFSGFPLDGQRFADDVINSKEISSSYSKAYKSVDDVLYPLIKVPFYAILPTLSNQRILNQYGAFLLFGMKVKKIEKSSNPGQAGTDYYHFTPIQYENGAEKFWKNSMAFRIPSIYKSSILEELELLGITKYKMFPELEYQSEFIANMIRREAKTG